MVSARASPSVDRVAAAERTPVALTIAGSDSGGGAGIQADLKAFAACGVHGTSAIVALTAQNTVGVTAIHPVPPQMILDQVRAVASDIGVDAVKVGMLTDEATIGAVAEALGELEGTPTVVRLGHLEMPVMSFELFRRIAHDAINTPFLVPEDESVEGDTGVRP